MNLDNVTARIFSLAVPTRGAARKDPAVHVSLSSDLIVKQPAQPETKRVPRQPHPDPPAKPGKRIPKGPKLSP